MCCSAYRNLQRSYTTNSQATIFRLWANIHVLMLNRHVQEKKNQEKIFFVNFAHQLHHTGYKFSLRDIMIKIQITLYQKNKDNLCKGINIDLKKIMEGGRQLPFNNRKKGRRQVKMEARTAVMQPQPRTVRSYQEPGDARSGFCPRASGRRTSLWPP